MKKTFIFILLAGLFSFRKESHKLSLEIKGQFGSTGSFRVALYRKGDNFPSSKGGYKTKIVSVENTICNFEGLSSGTYALAVYHDSNENGVMDVNFFGVPTEVYGFSNNVRGKFSAPSFQEASFELNSNRKLQIYLK